MQEKYRKRAIEILKTCVWKTPLTDDEYKVAWENGIFDGVKVLIAMELLAEEVEKELKDNLYTIEDIQDLQVEFAAEKLDMYTKQQVEELLEKQRELCAKKAITTAFHPIWGNDIDKDSILNAKLNIE